MTRSPDDGGYHHKTQSPVACRNMPSSFGSGNSRCRTPVAPSMSTQNRLLKMDIAVAGAQETPMDGGGP